MPYVIVIGFFLAILLLIRWSFRSRDKNGDGTGRYNPFSPGDNGEFAVARQLRRLPKEYMVINDLMFHNGKNRTTQIDHVVVSPYGIFVIETKNITGHIYGSAYAQHWKRYWRAWYRGIEHSNELEFQNPLLQNQAHIIALNAALEQFRPPQLISVIAFSPNAELKVHADGANILYWSQLRRFIRHHRTTVMSTDQTEAIYKYLRTINIREKDIRRQHAERAQRNKQYYMNNN
ncbi:MAG: NERD domain-containing protein [Paludibacteraceae bacterium]|nr:NERD domain-containing protein [Paludibacteraceae bacterium]